MDFLRFEEFSREAPDDDMIELLRNNPPDVVFSAFAQAFFRGALRVFNHDSEIKSIVLSDAHAREQAMRHFFHRALRAVLERRDQVLD